MRENHVKRGEVNINAGHIGGRASQASNYWDQILSMEDVALLLKMRITAIKMAVAEGGTINGLPAPKPLRNENDKMFFRGRDIEKLVLAGAVTNVFGSKNVPAAEDV